MYCTAYEQIVWLRPKICLHVHMYVGGLEAYYAVQEVIMVEVSHA